MIDATTFDGIFSVLRKHNVASFSCPDFQVTFSPTFGYGAQTTPFESKEFEDEPQLHSDVNQEAIELAERQNALKTAYGEQF